MTLTSKQLAEKIALRLLHTPYHGDQVLYLSACTDAVLLVLADHDAWFMHAPERMDDPTFGQPVLPLFEK